MKTSEPRIRLGERVQGAANGIVVAFDAIAGTMIVQLLGSRDRAEVLPREVRRVWRP